MEIVLKNVKKKDLPVIKSLAKSLNFDIINKIDKPYNATFVEDILEAEQSIKDGKGLSVKIEDLWK